MFFGWFLVFMKKWPTFLAWGVENNVAPPDNQRWFICWRWGYNCTPVTRSLITNQKGIKFCLQPIRSHQTNLSFTFNQSDRREAPRWGAAVLSHFTTLNHVPSNLKENRWIMAFGGLWEHILSFFSFYRTRRQLFMCDFCQGWTKSTSTMNMSWVLS